MKELVSVVIPVFNEDENILPMAERVVGAFARLPEYDHECIFVNDGSTDVTREAISMATERFPSVRGLHFVRNFGQSAALVAGMRAAEGDYILTLDGDLQNDPADFARFLELLHDYDCVCGYRAHRHDNWLRKVSSRIANSVRNAVLHDGIRDSGCGAKGYRRVCVRHLLPFNGMHRFVAVFIRAAGLSIVECPVSHHPRQFGISKYGVHNRLWRGIYDLFGVRWLRRRYVAYQLEDSHDPENRT